MTKGQLEAKISEAIIKFEKEFLGRGPIETKTYIIDDMVLVRLKGVLTRAEQQIANSKDIHNGLRLIKRVRREVIETNKESLCRMIKEIIGREVLSLHTDISTRTGERIIIFVLDNPQLDAGRT